jgi:exodeoxyribonuclease-5
MPDITLTPKQEEALRRAKDWFLNGTAMQQVLSIAGYAGTGKSTIINFLIEELGLDDSEVVFGTYTGKAAYVLRQKGTPCRTIHSLIYRLHDAGEAEIAEARRKLDGLEAAALELSGADRHVADVAIATLRLELKEMRQPHFGLNEESEVCDAKLVVLDEVSMVGDYMAADVLSFGKPVIVIDDPAQLPPIRGTGAFNYREPDVMLTEIHRQAAESAIIRLATMARMGQSIPYGQHDEFVWKMSGLNVTAEQLLRGGQVICGKNATRFALNNAMRRAAGFNGSALPTGPGEKIICLKNDNQLALLNGMFLTLDDIEEIDEIWFRATVTDEEGNLIRKGLPIYAGHFLDHQRLDPERDERDWKAKKRLIEATYGWAITAHKAQGSQWPNVIIIDDGWGRSREQRKQWLYTAITRAESGLVILD